MKWRDRNCDNCAYYIGQECRYNPPTLFAISNYELEKDSRIGIPITRYSKEEWPRIMNSHVTRCGRHKTIKELDSEPKQKEENQTNQ